MATCCTGCFDEPLIQQFIKETGSRKPCEFCGSKRRFAADTEAVGDFVREGLARAYEQADGYSPWAEPQSVADVFDYDFPIFSERLLDTSQERGLLETLMKDSGPSWHDIADGGIDLFRDIYSDSIAFKDREWGEELNRFAVSWSSFKFHVSHGLRFFEPKSEVLFRQTLASPLLELLDGLETSLSAGQRLYRVGRPFGTDLRVPMDPKEALAAAGPAPWDQAAEGRMNPAGISYTYLAEDVDTCLAEKRVEAGGHALVAEFVTTKELKILDLAVLPAIKVKSIFDADYDHDLHWAWGFAEAFRDEISSPVDPMLEPASYVPTQVLSEYFRLEGFEGIRFPSSQHPGGMNYALFCGPPVDLDELWHDYCAPTFSGWLRLERLSRVQILGWKPSHSTDLHHDFLPEDFAEEAEESDRDEAAYRHADLSELLEPAGSRDDESGSGPLTS